MDHYATGPVFTGAAQAAAHLFIFKLQERIGKEGVNRIHDRLHEVLKHPTGYYESKIHTERQSNDLVITDTPVIYGPWLEGVGSRNQSTKFKGYSTFRMVAKKLQRDTGAIALAELRSGGYLGDMNGI